MKGIYNGASSGTPQRQFAEVSTEMRWKRKELCVIIMIAKSLCDANQVSAWLG